ncbi:hypothetical protein BH23CHL8_BH23CHL8_16260 [soil metagenome]
MDDQKRRDADAMLSARTLWEDLAVKARGLHCPEHFVGPWRVVVIGETRDTLRLQVYGCCGRLGQAVTEMIREDPRVPGRS